MKYTEEAKQALSRSVAEKFGLIEWLGGYSINPEKWLHDDWHTIMELCVKYGVYASHESYLYVDKNDCVEAYIDDHKISSKCYLAGYSDCNDDPSLAERIARLQALAEV